MLERADRIKGAFAVVSLRNTKQRRLIADRLASLARCGRDCTTQDLWNALQIEDPGLGRATVYRAIELLDRVAFADGSYRYRLCGQAHHVTCVRCQHVVEADACPPPQLLQDVAAATGFTIEGHRPDLFGRCPSCRHSLD